MTTIAITEAQWEASDCRLKARRRKRTKAGCVQFQYSLCPHCQEGLETGVNKRVCVGIRCPTMKPNEPTMREVLEDFESEMPFSKREKEILEGTTFHLCNKISDGWDCPAEGCSHREGEFGDAADDYAASHGARQLGKHISSFCSYYVIRKLMASDPEKKIIYSIMSKLTFFLKKKELMDHANYQSTNRALKECKKTKGCKIMAALSTLKATNFWKEKPPQQGDDDDDYCNKEINDTKLYSFTFAPERGLEIERVGTRRWEFRADEETTSPIILRLPSNVAKMGLIGMRITCIRLGKRRDNGQYEPFNMDAGTLGIAKTLYGNVYPPELG